VGGALDVMELIGKSVDWADSELLHHIQCLPAHSESCMRLPK
jgi:hypothetical protein